LNWISQLNRMDGKRKVSQVFNDSPQGSRLRGRPKNRWRNCVQTDSLNKCKLQIGKRSQKTELTGKSPLWRRRSVLNCRAVEEEEEVKTVVFNSVLFVYVFIYYVCTEQTDNSKCPANSHTVSVHTIHGRPQNNVPRRAASVCPVHRKYVAITTCFTDTSNLL
jgi:hypothetical protein